jgi:hypothetical protein
VRRRRREPGQRSVRRRHDAAWATVCRASSARCAQQHRQPPVENCDGTDDAACPGFCQPPGDLDECMCRCAATTTRRGYGDATASTTVRVGRVLDCAYRRLQRRHRRYAGRKVRRRGCVGVRGMPAAGPRSVRCRSAATVT